MSIAALKYFSYESIIAEYLSCGQNVRFSEGFVTFDDRLLQLKCAQHFENEKEIIALGSSTCLQIRAGHFANRCFYNHSLRRGVLEDIFAVYQIHRTLRFRPRVVIIGVDGWIFDPSHWKSYWRVLYKQFFNLIADWRIDLHANENFAIAFRRQLDRVVALGMKNKWKSMLSLASRCSKHPKFEPTSQEFTEDYTKRVDGSVGYHLGFRGRSAQEVSSIIAASTKLPRYTIALSYQRALEAFTLRLLEQGVRVIFFIPPHHPAVFRLRTGNAQGNPVLGWSEYVANLERVEDYLRNVLCAHGAEIVGSYSPEQFQAGDDAFYDWMHPKEELVKRLFESISI